MPDRCVVYNCTGGYDSDRRYRKENGLPQLSQFRPKKEMVPEWEKRISRGGGWKLKTNHTICEMHFEKKYIKECHQIQGNGVHLSEKVMKKSLTDDAVPTIFDGYPSYKTCAAPKKRKAPKERETSTLQNKRPKHSAVMIRTEESITENTTEYDAVAKISQEDSLLCDKPISLNEAVFQDAHAIPRPNENWHIHKGPAFVSFVHIDSEGISIDKFIKFKIEETHPEICILRHNIFEEPEVTGFEDVSSLLRRVDELKICPGTGQDGVRSSNCPHYINETCNRKQIRCTHCTEKKRSTAKQIRRQMLKKIKNAHNKTKKKNKIRNLAKKVVSRNKKVAKLKEKVDRIMEKCAQIKKEELQKKIQDMPPKWQLAILTCSDAAKAKSSTGRRYTTQWIYECQLLRIKSLALYKKLLRDNFLPLPSLRTLQRYMKQLKPAYGFVTNTFTLLEEKAAYMTEAERHGSLLVDEMKLSEGLWLDKESLKILGFVNLDKATQEAQKDIPGDHALVMMFQGFRGQYFQSVAAFLSRGAVKGEQLAKLVLEAVCLLEKSGFFVDAIVSDAASWNRAMWAQFGLKKKGYESQGSKKRFDIDDEDVDDQFEDLDLQLAFPTKRKMTKKQKKKTNSRKKKSCPVLDLEEVSLASCMHPVDDKRRLWFVSDFPHLIKSMKQRIVNAKEIETPEGKVKLNHWVIVCKEDEKKGIKVAPKLSMQLFQTESYIAMSVKGAFSFFSEEAATAMEHYKKIEVAGMEDCESTVKFIRRVNVLIDVMNSNTRGYGLKQIDQDGIPPNPPACPDCQRTHSENTPQRRETPRKVLNSFLDFLERWETSGIPRDRRLTASAAYGLRVTIMTALELSLYLTEKLKYEYFMTRRLNQDALEHFFGEIRQGCGAHGHPDPAQFIQVYRLMCFKALVKPPRGSNVTGGEMLSSLLAMSDEREAENKTRQMQLERELDEALNTGEIVSGPFSDHTYYESLTVDMAALRYFGGYVARRIRKISIAKSCEECFSSLQAPRLQALSEDDNIIHGRSQGYLIIPSTALMAILEKLEISVLEVFQQSHLHQDLIYEVSSQVQEKEFDEIGCIDHKRLLTKAVMSFYLKTRLIFACEEYHKRLSENSKKKSKAKQQQKLFRLTC